MNDFLIDNAIAQDQNQDPTDQQGLWLTNLSNFGFDGGGNEGYYAEANEIVGIRWSGHTHTKFGIRGRDKIAK
jgi:hypothetical protein